MYRCTQEVSLSRSLPCPGGCGEEWAFVAMLLGFLCWFSLPILPWSAICGSAFNPLVFLLVLDWNLQSQVKHKFSSHTSSRFTEQDSSRLKRDMSGSEATILIDGLPRCPRNSSATWFEASFRAIDELISWDPFYEGILNPPCLSRKSPHSLPATQRVKIRGSDVWPIPYYRLFQRPAQSA